MSYLETLSEVRRISAGGKPRRIKRGLTINISAARLKWQANDYVLRLLEKMEARP